MSVVRAAATYRPQWHIDADEIESIWGRTHGSGIERKTVAGPDEDALTMAVEAAKRLIGPTEINPETVEMLIFATTNPPLEEGELTPQIVSALGLPERCRTIALTQSIAGASDALLTALETVEGGDNPALVLAADAPQGDVANEDHRFGAGAAAFLVTADGDGAILDEKASYTIDAPGLRFRERGRNQSKSLDAKGYERSTIQSCFEGVIKRLEDENADIHVLHQPDMKKLRHSSIAVGATEETVSRGTVVDTLGDAGSATVPIALAVALLNASVGESCIASTFGGGSRATALKFTVDGPVTGSITSPTGSVALSYDKYLRYRDELGEESISGGGANVSLPSWQRTISQRYRLTAGQCPSCQSIVFPPTGACTNCYENVTYDDVTLRPTGTIKTVTEIGAGGSPPEFAPLQRQKGSYAVALIKLRSDSEEGSVLIPAQLTDCDPGSMTAGMSVRAVWRYIYEQDGIPRYGVKFAPDSG